MQQSVTVYFGNLGLSLTLTWSLMSPVLSLFQTPRPCTFNLHIVWIVSYQHGIIQMVWPGSIVPDYKHTESSYFKHAAEWQAIRNVGICSFVLLCDLYCGQLIQLWTYLAWKASRSLGSRMFSSGSQVLYLFREETVSSEDTLACQTVADFNRHWLRTEGHFYPQKASKGPNPVLDLLIPP